MWRKYKSFNNYLFKNMYLLYENLIFFSFHCRLKKSFYKQYQNTAKHWHYSMEVGSIKHMIYFFFFLLLAFKSRKLDKYFFFLQLQRRMRIYLNPFWKTINKVKPCESILLMFEADVTKAPLIVFFPLFPHNEWQCKQVVVDRLSSLSCIYWSFFEFKWFKYMSAFFLSK